MKMSLWGYKKIPFRSAYQGTGVYAVSWGHIKLPKDKDN